MTRFICGLWLLAATTAFGASSGLVERDHAQVALVSEVDSIQPGEPFRLGLVIEHEPEWHTYWRNPGDSGLETRLDWKLPDGFSAGSIQWPWPERHPIEHLVNYGYSGSLLLPVQIQPSEDLEPGPVTLAVKANWLVCKIECIPGSAELKLTLPVRQSPPAMSEQSNRFANADRRIPEPVDWPAHFDTDGERLSIQVTNAGILQAEGLELFVAEPMLVEHADAPFTAGLDGTIQLSQSLSPFFTGAPETLDFVVVDPDKQRGWRLKATPGRFESVGPAADLAINSDTHSSSLPWPVLLLMAFAGGVLLNLMPCVFPVLSLKAMSLVSAGHAQRCPALAYTAGVLVSFALLAAVLLSLRAAGEAIGWGFQLQSPWFVGVLIYVLFAMALSLSGLFEIAGGWTGLGQGLTEKRGLTGSFFTGVLAAVVASPCTAPFMGTALGLGVLLPTAQAFTVFLALGLGLALPLALIGLVPALARLLPRPGAWMQTFRQLMAFPLYLTVVWLLWVVARQTGVDGITAILSGLVALAFSMWLIGQRASGLVETLRHVTVAASLIIALVALAAAGRFEASAASDSERWWEPWSEARLNELRADPARAVFVNMTADWCVTCLVNEGVALNKDAVRDAFETAGVTYLKGDWTRRDPAITRYLEIFDRNGVPLYVFYPANGTDAPRVLPQILTPATIIEFIQTDT